MLRILSTTCLRTDLEVKYFTVASVCFLLSVPVHSQYDTAETRRQYFADPESVVNGLRKLRLCLTGITTDNSHCLVLSLWVQSAHHYL